MSNDNVKDDGSRKKTPQRKRTLKKYVYPDVSHVEKIIGYKFKNNKLLETALTHTSFTNEQKAQKMKAVSNERLEFLGDSVLSLVSSSYIYNLFAGFDEGDLTKIRSEVVCEDSLYGFALKMNLGDYLFLGKGEINSNGRRKKSILADALEALIGAIYLDGGYGAASFYVLNFIKEPIDKIIKTGVIKDYKTVLQQFIQNGTDEKLKYVLKSEDGPDHDKKFQVDAMLGSNVIGSGSGGSKREAEQESAKNALELFGYKR